MGMHTVVFITPVILHYLFWSCQKNSLSVSKEWCYVFCQLFSKNRLGQHRQATLAIMPLLSV